MKKRIENLTYTEERALFQLEDAEIYRLTFEGPGESCLKEGKHYEVNECTFDWYYPLWYGEDILIHDSTLTVNARAAVWYASGAKLVRIKSNAPKILRSSKGLTLEDSSFDDAAEMLWWNEDVHLSNCSITGGDYFGLGTLHGEFTGMSLKGKYTFDHSQDIHIRDSHIISKDVFWNSKNVVVENSYIDSQYIGWNSENLTFINCEIHSHQGFCYIKGVTMINCRLIDTDLAFEYCENVNIESTTPIDSIKNPYSGKISAPSIGEIIFDDPKVDPSKTKIIVRG